jgi:cytochrome c biogenesis factor
MIPEIGQFALILAFATAVYQFAVPMYGPGAVITA